MGWEDPQYRKHNIMIIIWSSCSIKISQAKCYEDTEDAVIHFAWDIQRKLY